MMDDGKGKEKILICRCEEVSEEDVVQAIREGAHTITAIKRKTRAGMGLCQGRTCERQIMRILCRELGVSPEELETGTSRFPVRPTPTRLIGELPHEPNY